MPQKDKNQNSSTRLTTGGFANIIVLIIFLLTMGGTVLYFKNFPLEKLPAGEPTEQPEEAVKEIATKTLSSDKVPTKQIEANGTKEEEIVGLLKPTEIEICLESGVKLADERAIFADNFNMGPKPSAEEYKVFQEKLKVMDKKANDITACIRSVELQDKDQIINVKRMQAALDFYLDSCKSYPIVSNLAIVGSSQFGVSFNKGCPDGVNLKLFMERMKITKKYKNFQYCSEETSESGKCGIPASGKAESYRLTFKLESQQGSLAPGVHVATPKGIQ